MTRDFERIARGMSQEQVKGVLGPPDDEYPTSFGSGKMTTWTYHTDGETFFVWFDENNKVKLKSDK